MERKRKRRLSDGVNSGSMNSSVKKFQEQEEKIRKMEDEHKQRPDLPKEDPNVPLIRPVAEKEENCLDLVFAMDCTGSMSPYIETARDNIRKIVEEIVASEKSDVRLALIEYRDHPPEDKTFVTRVHDFTFSPKNMRDWLAQADAIGGGDTAEAVTDALNDVLKLTWRDSSVKICVLVSDAPPHGINCSIDGFPDGCPLGLDPLQIVGKMASEGITLYTVGCEPNISLYREFFMAISFITGGQYVPLTAAKLLTDVIIGGAQEEISLESIMAEVDKEVQEEMAAGREIESSVFASKVHTKLQTKGTEVKQLRMNNSELETAMDSPVAKRIATMNSLEEVRKFYKPNSSDVGLFGGRSSSGGLFGAATGVGFGGFSGGTGSNLFGAKFGGGTGASFGTTSSAISYNQTSRLVMKSIARNNASFKKD